MAEKRRLLYVAMTSSKETCVLTYAKSRFRNGQTVQTRASRFLSEIGRKFVQTESSADFEDNTSFSGHSFTNPTARYSERYMNTTSPKRVGSIVSDRKSVSETDAKDIHTADEITPGTVIIHAKLGEGTVRKLDYVMGEGVITVDFRQAGEKKLYLRFARFTIKSK